MKIVEMTVSNFIISFMWAGGTPVGPAMLRMLVWGDLAMGASAWVGHWSGEVMG